ncbi:NB-ARC domain-containing protein [Amycolatopsis sp. NPDC089917]|uniref:NB-ARC domain-containing protein n=1 Tax=Amycolatopsis sp. NPDC089917 TaxID=3155187 RepID=UPI00342787E8
MKREWVDYLRFVQAITEAKQVAGRDRLDRLRAALREWRGDPLLDTCWTDFDLSRERAVLQKSRRSAMFDYLTSMLDCRDFTDFPGVAREALELWPEDKGIKELVAQAPVDAGIRGWPEGASVAVAGVDRSLDSPVPRQLPGHQPSLVGRAVEHQFLCRTLLGTGSGVALIVGMAGVGKTLLACAWAREFSRNFPGGVLYADLHGYSRIPPERPTQILTRMLADLGVVVETTTLDGLISRFRTVTADRRVLVVLDDARDAAQADPLLPGLGSAAIVTSRNRLDGLTVRADAYPIKLEPLDSPTAGTLFNAALAQPAKPELAPVVAEISELVGRLPLALTIVGARARRQVSAVSDTLAELRQARNRLDVLELDRELDLDVRVALSYSCRGLSVGAAELLALLPCHPGPTISKTAVSALLGRESVTEVDELVAAHLLEQPAADRYAMHDLVRDYAVETAEMLPDELLSKSRERTFEFLLHYTWACDRVLVPGRDVPIVLPEGLVQPVDEEDAMRRLDLEYETATAVLRLAEALGADRYVWLLEMALLTYQWRRSRFADAEAYLIPAAAAAERVASLRDQAMVYRMLAGSRWNLRNYSGSKETQRRAIELSEKAGDARGVAYGHVGLAALHLEQDENIAAGIEYEKAVSIFSVIGDLQGEAEAIRGGGEAALAMGDLETAERASEESIRRYEQSGDRNGRAGAMALLGKVHQVRTELAKAAAAYDLSVSLYRSISRDSHEARTLLMLAEVLRTDGRAVEGSQALDRARILYQKLGDEPGMANVDRMRGMRHAPR